MFLVWTLGVSIISGFIDMFIINIVAKFFYDYNISTHTNILGGVAIALFYITVLYFMVGRQSDLDEDDLPN